MSPAFLCSRRVLEEDDHLEEDGHLEVYLRALRRDCFAGLTRSLNEIEEDSKSDRDAYEPEARKIELEQEILRIRSKQLSLEEQRIKLELKKLELKKLELKKSSQKNTRNSRSSASSNEC